MTVSLGRPQWTTLFKLSLVLCTFSLLFRTARAQDCPDQCVRKEWRNLSPDERFQYVNTVAAFYKSDPNGYNYFPSEHERVGGSGIHGSAQFLPWHRYFLLEWQKQLRNYKSDLCIAFWQASADRNDLGFSPVFSETTGFGPLTDACVTFPGLDGNLVDGEHGCVFRTNERTARIDPYETLNQLVVESSTFEMFTQEVEGPYHGGVHLAVGGIGEVRGHMSLYRSPMDPVFFLHHCFIDRLWALWQDRDPSTRLSDLSFYNPAYENFHLLETNMVGTNLPSGNFMDISKLCYSYDNSEIIGVSRRSLVPRSPPQKSNKNLKAAKSNGHSKAKSKYGVKNGVLDMGEICLLEPIAPLTDAWIDLNRLNKAFVRDFEGKKKNTIDKINNIEGFISRSVPAGDYNKLKDELDKFPGITKVAFSARGYKLTLPFVDSAVTAQAMINASKQQSLPKGGGKGKSKKQQLAEIIGESAFAGTSIPNPLDVSET